MDNLERMTKVLSIAKRGQGICFMIFCWLTDVETVPYEERPGLLSEFLLQYWYSYTSEEKSPEDEPPKEELERYKKELQDKYIDDIYDRVAKNLPEEEFYDELCEFVFGEDGEEPSMDMYWRFYSCVISTALPYCRVDIENVSLPSQAEYASCKHKLKDELLRMDAIVLDPEFDDIRKKAQATLEQIEQRKSKLERTILLEELLYLSYYASSHWSDLLKFRNEEKDFDIIIEGEHVGSFSHPSDNSAIFDALRDMEYIPKKELYKAYEELPNESMAKSYSIMRFIETGKIETYIAQAQILLDHIEKEPDFVKRVALLIGGLRYFVDLKKTIENEKSEKESYTMRWYLWDFWDGNNR